jgi:hypothetical protein
MRSPLQKNNKRIVGQASSLGLDLFQKPSGSDDDSGDD